jgi:Na+-transporting NADH:ubiquinone oxidoreductase subunit C
MAGIEWNPWRRLLALSNESRTKTIIIAFLVSGLCAVLVSSATVVLRPIQAANRAAEEQARIGDLVAGIPGMSALLEDTGGTLSTVVIDLEAGRAATDITRDMLDTALTDAANWTTLDASADLAGLGQRPNYVQIFLLRTGEDVTLALLPITGQGYGGRIDAILALHSDMNTIAGIAITAHSETPGLGGRIEDPSWQQGFPDTLLRDDSDDLRFAVARGDATSPFEVDGITGATRTGRGVTGMVRFWLGPDGYGPLLAAIQRGDF